MNVPNAYHLSPSAAGPVVKASVWRSADSAGPAERVPAYQRQCRLSTPMDTDEIGDKVLRCSSSAYYQEQLTD